MNLEFGDPGTYGILKNVECLVNLAILVITLFHLNSGASGESDKNLFESSDNGDFGD